MTLDKFEQHLNAKYPAGSKRNRLFFDICNINKTCRCNTIAKVSRIENVGTYLRKKYNKIFKALYQNSVFVE